MAETGWAFNPYTFYQFVKQSVPGSNSNGADDGGFLWETDQTPLLAGSALSTLVSTGGHAFSALHVTRDYDQTSDNLQFRFLGSTSANITEVIWAWLSNVQVPGASTVTSTTPQSTIQTFSTGIFTAFSVSVSGNGLSQDDVYTLNISTSAYTGNANPPPISTYGFTEVYSSCLVAWDQYGSEMVGNASTQLIRSA